MRWLSPPFLAAAPLSSAQGYLPGSSSRSTRPRTRRVVTCRSRSIMVDIQNGITIGQALLVRYQGYDLWHERVPLARVNRHSYVVVTPELDVYSEQLMIPPLSGMRFMGADRLLPLGLDENNVHRFNIRNRPNGTSLMTTSPGSGSKARCSLDPSVITSRTSRRLTRSGSPQLQSVGSS